MGDPDLIIRAPTEADGEDYDLQESDFYSTLVAELQQENDELRSLLETERAESDIKRIKAKMMEPYADKVFSFVCAYCTLVSVLIVLSGIQMNGFVLSNSVLTVIAGSTAVSVIGLITIVLSGLFGRSG